MSSVVHNENKIILPFTLGVWAISLIVLLAAQFSKMDFGPVGIIAWIVSILGILYFAMWVLAQIFG